MNPLFCKQRPFLSIQNHVENVVSKKSGCMYVWAIKGVGIRNIPKKSKARIGLRYLLH